MEDRNVKFGRSLRIALMFAVAASLATVVGCGPDPDKIGQGDDSYERPIEVRKVEPDFVESPTDSAMTLPNTSGKTYVVFAYSGENLAYHMALLNATPIIILPKNAGAQSKSARHFDETTSLGNPSTGNDRVNFQGKWDGEKLTGIIDVSTDGVTTFSESGGSNTFGYFMVGDLVATRVPGTNTLKGTITGTSTLEQVLSTSDGPEPEDKRTVSWTITGEIVGE